MSFYKDICRGGVIISQYLNEGRCYKEQIIIIIYVKNCSVVFHCQCAGYVQFHWSFCLKFSAVDWRSVSLFNGVFYRQEGERNVLVCIISNSFDLLHFISFEIMFRCPSVHIHLIFPEKFQGDFDESFGIIQNALIPQSRHGFCDVLDSIGCWLSVCCIGVWLVPYQIYAGLIWDLLQLQKVSVIINHFEI